MKYITLDNEEVLLIKYLLSYECQCLDKMWADNELPEFIVDYYNSIIQELIKKLD